MRTVVHCEPSAGVHRPARPARPARAVLVALTALALVGAGAAVARAPAASVDPDLMRVVRFMAAMKGGFALAALAACFWRLARPAAPWRMAAYLAGPPAMAAGAVALWASLAPAAAAACLHLGLFTVVAAALTDPGFIPDRWPGRAQR
ncbi:hypothetical protein [Methylobacterium sp. J-076]|uniref:hypothetical protein n=1 Tax=Methylobacterium sp. J-076 TaxID=2836655 RepID=UPI001FB9821B|nr:hypothetical protein [Methylobacterium sp. J-076]MCJ2012746.1 hypothetical protein [Methylobacterium sp. J-076]